MKDWDHINKLISQGNTEAAFAELLQVRHQFSTSEKVEVDFLAARYNSLRLDIDRDLISYVEGQRELSKIKYALLKFLNKEMEGDGSTKDLVEKIEELGRNFEKASEIQNNASRLREKNQIIMEISKFLFELPSLLDHFVSSGNQGIISGIALKVKTVPNIQELDILEKISQRSIKNFSKGNIVNALAELVYSGQLRIGDDLRIKKILEVLGENSDFPLQKNIERVEAALAYHVRTN